MTVNGDERVHVHDDVEEVYVELDDHEVEPFRRALAAAGFALDRRPPYEPPPPGSPDSPWTKRRFWLRRLRRWRADGSEAK